MISVMQLKRYCDVFPRWRRDALYDALMKASKNPPEFLHNELVLELATTFADSGLGPELVEPHLDNRRPISDFGSQLTGLWRLTSKPRCPCGDIPASGANWSR